VKIVKDENKNVSGNRIFYLRKENNLTQAQLGEKVGKSRLSISYYEDGEQTPNCDVLIKMSYLFDCSSDYLLGLSDVKKQASSQSEDAIGTELYNIEALIRNSRSRKHYIEALKMFISVLSTVENADLSRKRLVHRLGSGKTFVELDHNDNEVPGTKRIISPNRLMINLNPIASCEKEIREKLAAMSEMLHDKVWIRANAEISGINYSISDNEDD